MDYDARRRALSGLDDADPATLLAGRADGRVKMFVATRALTTRAALRDLYEHGDYVALEASGTRSDCLFAFARGNAITCVPRLIATLTPDGAAPLGPSVWGDTRITLADGRAVRDVFTGAVLTPAPAGNGYALDAAVIFERFPVALLVPVDPSAQRARPAHPADPARPAPLA